MHCNTVFLNLNLWNTSIKIIINTDLFEWLSQKHGNHPHLAVTCPWSLRSMHLISLADNTDCLPNRCFWSSLFLLAEKIPSLFKYWSAMSIRKDGWILIGLNHNSSIPLQVIGSGMGVQCNYDWIKNEETSVINMHNWITLLYTWT